MFQMNFVRNISHSAQTLPVVVHGHFPFINFKKLVSCRLEHSIKAVLPEIKESKQTGFV